MNDTRNKTSVIPKLAYVLAGIAYVAGYLVMRYAAIPSDPKSVYWPEGGKLLLCIVLPLIAVAYILLIGYVYGDSRRRLMRAWLWTLLAIFIPNLIGIILYFLLRDPMPFYCSKCGASVKSAYTFCPNCAAALRPTCPQCGRAMERGWAHCPQCGAAATAPGQNKIAAPAASPPSQPL
jgi:RNA polymerase subunit RPABC4/transcription elongation factor Spt4